MLCPESFKIEYKKTRKIRKINLITFRHPLTYTRKHNNNYNKILQQHSFEIRKIPKNFKIKKIIKKIIGSSIAMIPAHKKEDGLCRTKNNREVRKRGKKKINKKIHNLLIQIPCSVISQPPM